VIEAQSQNHGKVAEFAVMNAGKKVKGRKRHIVNRHLVAI